MLIFFTSDSHFDHGNIISYCGRPFTFGDGSPDVGCMNAEIIRRYNDRVGTADICYHLGDFAFAPIARISELRRQLNGRIVLLCGNHDRVGKSLLRSVFDEVHGSSLVTEFGGKKFLLGHYPVPDGREFELLDRQGCDFKLCGHVHEAWSRKGRNINVGVDVRGFRPISSEEVLDIVAS
jgi:calcineurin-like phosphoesterase family protein